MYLSNFNSVYNLNSYIRFSPPNYYGDDHDLPILERICHTRKRLYSVEEIVRILLNPSLKSSKFLCSKVPTSISEGVSFVVDLNSLENADDLSSDDMGVWRNNRVDTAYAEVTMGKSSVHLVKKCSAKDTKSNTYKVKRVYRVHATDNTLKKITAFIYGKYTGL